jgi:hypothetical protein
MKLFRDPLFYMPLQAIPLIPTEAIPGSSRIIPSIYYPYTISSLLRLFQASFKKKYKPNFIQAHVRYYPYFFLANYYSINYYNSFMLIAAYSTIKPVTPFSTTCSVTFLLGT